MFGFDVNRPTDMQSIAGALSSYATPEAAEMDFTKAPGGRDYLTNQYQRLSGDYFADPFADFFKGHTDDMVQAAMHGGLVATGSNTGMRMLSRPMTPPPPLLPPPNSMAPAAQPLSSLSPLGNKEASNSLITQMLQNSPQMNRLQIPDPSSNDYLKVLEQRASLAGARDEFIKINQTNPTALKYGARSDPRFSVDSTGKVIAEDELHPLANDTTIRDLIRTNPIKGHALFHALTGQDYTEAIQAKTASMIAERKNRQEHIKGIKGIETDEITGDRYKVVEKSDPLTGGVVQHRVPLTPLDEAIIAKEKGTKGIFGVDLPGEGGLPKVPGMTNAGHEDYRARAAELHKLHPELTTAQVSQQTLASMKAEQSKAGVTSGQNPSLVEMLSQFDPNEITAKMTNANVVAPANVLKEMLNLPSRATNVMSALMGSNYRAATIPNIPFMDSSSLSGDAVKKRALLAKWLIQKSGMADRAFVGQ